MIVLGEELELRKSALDCLAVGIGIVVAVEGLEDIHRLGVLANLSVGLAVHEAAGVLPWSAGTEMARPGAGHLGLGVIVPIGSSASAGMVGDLSDRDGGVAMVAKPGRHVGLDDLVVGGVAEKGAVVARPVATGEQGVARRSAGGSVHVVSREGAAACGQFVDVGGVNVVGTKALQLGTKVVDADEEDVGVGCEAGSEEREGGREDQGEAFHERDEQS